MSSYGLKPRSHLYTIMNIDSPPRTMYVARWIDKLWYIYRRIDSMYDTRYNLRDILMWRLRKGSYETYLATKAYSTLTRTWFYETDVYPQWTSRAQIAPS